MDDGRPELPRSAFDSPTFGQDGSFRVEKPVGSATISPCGRDVALASRQGLYIIDLDSPWSPPRHLVYLTPWEVADVQWSPFAARDHWIVSTSNQNALVWNLNMQSRLKPVEHVLRAHTRAVSDINFSAHYPDILATCAVDSFVHCWDLRYPVRPALSFCDWFAGATQVKWNRTNPHILASSHDKYLRIWDDRKGATPLKSIEAHTTKIYGVDWNRFKTTDVATCSLDKTIKFWDYTKEGTEPERIFQTPFPVWRARHTPFGNGLLAMPQRGDNDLHLYECRNRENGSIGTIAKAVHTFEGHRDQVKEFLWRPRGNVSASVDARDFQLVSWGADRVLRLHEVKKEVLESVGYHKGMEVKRATGFTRRGATYKSFRDSPVTDELDLFPTVLHSMNGQPGPTMQLPSSMNIYQSSSAFAVGSREFVHKSSHFGTKGRVPNDIDPISWMRGVKIGKRSVSPTEPHHSLSAVTSPALKAQPVWDVYESLGEEVTVVGDKFSKIIFEDVDMQRRKVVVSFSGPWGNDASSAYLNVTINFPTGYPSMAIPIISIERTASIRNELVKQLQLDVEVLATAFMNQGRNSLESILKFLLGEQSLSESMQTLRLYQNGEDAALIQNDEPSSSDDDDEGLGGYEDQSNSADAIDPLIAMNNAQNNVPLPKACGALWANNGLLVCFFPAKQEKEASILDQSLRSSTRHRNAISEGFGKLHDILGRRKATKSGLGTTEDEESDLEDCETLSSDSMSSQDSSPLQPHLLPAMTWESNGFDNFHKLILDGSLKSAGDLDTMNSPAPKASVVVSLHDLNSLLPAKQCLAKEYKIGNDYHHAIHNASVAISHGFREVANVWSLIALILQEKVPVHLTHNPLVEDSVVKIAHRAELSIWSDDSAIDLSFSDDSEDDTTLSMDQVSWGSHPLGNKWLVKALFDYYERQADVQMLAMMSCIFSQSGDKAVKKGDAQKFAFSPNQLSHSSSYYPSLEVAVSLSGFSLQSSPQKLLSINSTSSSAGASISDQLAFSYETNTPPGPAPSRLKSIRRDSQTTSLSASPEHQRRSHRSNSNLTAMAASFARPFSLSNSAASSPPNSFPRKRASPSGSYMGATPLSITWVSPGLFGKTSNVKEDSTTSISLSISDTEDDVAPPPLTTNNVAQVSGFTTKLKNQKYFHDEGHAQVPLLDAADEWRFAAFREAYGELFFAWNLANARCELLKYNNSLQATTDRPDFNKTTPSIGSLPADSKSLTFGLHCTICSSASEISSSRGQCSNCARTLRPVSCAFCNTYIHGLASPCLHCGHMLHSSCRKSVAEIGLQECVSGCGCICSDHAIIDIPKPETRRRGNGSIRDVSPAITVIADSTASMQDIGSWKGSEWEEMAYESLSRNLRRERRGSGRVVRERVSQIWRGNMG